MPPTFCSHNNDIMYMYLLSLPPSQQPWQRQTWTDHQRNIVSLKTAIYFGGSNKFIIALGMQENLNYNCTCEYSETKSACSVSGIPKCKQWAILISSIVRVLTDDVVLILAWAESTPSWLTRLWTICWITKIKNVILPLHKMQNNPVTVLIWSTKWL